MTNTFDGESRKEILRLREMLDSNSPEDRKTAAKRVTNLMRAGENVGILYSSMQRCVRTDDLELKKLAYYYLVNYASANSEESIMTVSTFIQDCQDPNPLIRALSIRTMTRIKVESFAENMVIPLKQTLSDKDPYVRKTAALAVCKLYDVIPESVENSGLIDELIKLLMDENPMVVSNTTAALFEINNRRSVPCFTLNKETVSPVISAMTQCSGWVQTVLLDALAQYTPVSAEEAGFLIDRLISFLKHSNPAVIIGAFKCIYLYLEKSQRPPQEVFAQILPPFITLVSSGDPEIQFVVLKTLSLFCKKYPNALAKEIRVFFCKYNDPSYVKQEKLEIIVTICPVGKVQLVLDELEEYTNSVDVGFVRSTIDTIGKLALKLEVAARRCVDILVKAVESKAEYAIEESIIVMADILRKFPGNFEGVISKVCANLETIKDPRARGAAVWMLGEYSDQIEHVDVLLDPFIDTFVDENSEVQHQILAALVKAYVRHPDDTKEQLQFILNEAMKPTILPDVRDRALMYWRLLSNDTEFAKQAVTFSKQAGLQYEQPMDPAVLKELIDGMGRVSGVLRIVAGDFGHVARYLPEQDETDENDQLRNWTRLALSPDDGCADVFCDWGPMTFWLKIVAKNTLTDLAIALNKNSLGLAIASNPQFPAKVDFGETIEIPISLVVDEIAKGNESAPALQLALRVNGSSKAFWAPFNLGNVLQKSSGELDLLNIIDESEATFNYAGLTIAEDSHLAAHGINIKSKDGSTIDISFTLPIGKTYNAKVSQVEQGVTMTVRGDPALFPLIERYGSSLLSF